jgi:hypothetical protein
MQFNAHVARRNNGATPRPETRQGELRRYFEYSESGVEVLEDGLKEITFGEYLVEQGVLDRFQLLRALQMQDRLPGVRLGECAAALGYAPILAIEKLYAQYAQLHVVEVSDTGKSEPIELVPEAEGTKP